MVDIVVVTYNARSVLAECLASIRRHTPASQYRLYVVNNASTDGTREFLDKSRPANSEIFHLSKNLGFSGAANWVTPKLRSEYVIFLDDDAAATPGWFAGIMRTAKNTKKLGMVGCKIIFPDKRIFSCEVRLGPRRLLFYKDYDCGQADYIKEVDILAGACFLVPLKILKKIGPFDESFFPCQGEDWDYCVRIRKAGYKIIYNGKVTILHMNLFRAGGTKVNLENKDRFNAKWHKYLVKNFPRKDSHVADKLMSKAIQAVQADDSLTALRLSDKLSKTHPKFVELWVPALAHIKLKNYRKALPYLRKIIARNPDNYSARNYLTLCLRNLGMKNEAEKYTAKMFHCVTHNISKIRKGAKA
jgi:GT2 family glycosyltransferase